MNFRKKFLPIERKDMSARGWKSCDIIIVTGDAYVDHPAFGAAVIGRLLESQGFRVGIIAQPSWDGPEDFQRLGRPELAFMITAGNIDSMVAHYTAGNKPRRDDNYSPGGKGGLRPDRATIAYTSRVRQAYKGIPVIIGGIEASLRRLSHYDYWSDRIRRSILLDSKADLLIYGMGEHPVTEVCARLRRGEDIRSIDDVPGTVCRYTARDFSSAERTSLYEEIRLPPFELVAERIPTSNSGTDRGKRAYAESVHIRLQHENPLKPERLIEEYPDCVVVQNPISPPLSTAEMDAVYALPFTRKAHPVYDSKGGIPALREVSFSITSTRGCFGGCSFCALTFHQGRIIQSRSASSLIHEAETLTRDPDFKGYIHDVGGPTANFRKPACSRQSRTGPCADRECLFPKPCPALTDSHEEYLSILTSIRKLPDIKKVFIRSGIRYDYLLTSASQRTRERFMEDLCRHHVSGQLKVAPEHISPRVLDAMGKPEIALFDRFSLEFSEINKRIDKRQYIIPYFISGHPGSTLEDAVELALYLKRTGFIPDQVQDFYPTPGTVSTCMYYTGLDPRPGRDFAPIYVPKGREKHLQRALLHFHKKDHYKLVHEALTLAGRTDLIGSGHSCLIQERGERSPSMRKRRTGSRPRKRRE